MAPIPMWNRLQNCKRQKARLQLANHGFPQFFGEKVRRGRLIKPEVGMEGDFLLPREQLYASTDATGRNDGHTR